jgi:hypothetical protein
MQVEEFTACMGHAAGFGHALGNQRLVACIIVADERAAPVAEKTIEKPSERACAAITAIPCAA